MRLHRVLPAALLMMGGLYAPSADAAFIRRSVIKTQLSGNSIYNYKAVVVVSDDESDEIDSVQVDLEPVGDAPLPDTTSLILPLKRVKANGNKRYVYTDLTFSDSPLDETYLVAATMLDSDGAAVGDTLDSAVVVTEGTPIVVASVKLRAVDDVSFTFKVVVRGDEEYEVASIDAFVADSTGPALLPKEFRLTEATGDDERRIFESDSLTFEDPKAAVGETYTFVVEMKDKAGVSLGYTEAVVVVDAL